MKPESLALATLGICPAESRALIAATRVLEGRLPALVDWFDTPDRADVVVRNLDTPRADWPTLRDATVIVPYRASGAAPASGVSRPLRMSVLQEALTWALEQALARRQPGQEQVARRVYRGREEIGKPTPRRDAGTTSAPVSPGFVRVYRGRAIK
ncbi:MAG: hypothetical protein ACX94A_03375 [Algiphilus sp.]